MSRLTSVLRRNGLTVSINSFPLEKFLKTFYGTGKVLVLGTSLYQKYSVSAIHAIQNFINSGGGVLVLVEHDNLFGNADFQNELTGLYGITASPASAYGVGKNLNARQWPVCSSFNWDFKEIKLYVPAPLKVTPPAIPLLKINKPGVTAKRIVGAINDANKGTLAVLGDAEILWNMTSTSGIRAGDNIKFLLKLFKMLANIKGVSGEIKNKIDSFKEYSPAKGIVLFDTSGLGLLPDDSVSGLKRFAEELNKKGYNIKIGNGRDLDYSSYRLVVIAAPIEKIKVTENIIKAEKILLVSDGLSDMLGEDTVYLKILKDVMNETPDIEEYYYPLNEISEKFGFHFLSATIFKAAKHHFYVKAGWLNSNNNLLIRRGTCVVPTENKFPAELKVLCRTDGTARLVKNYLSIKKKFSLTDNPFIKPEADKRQTGLAVIINTPQVFAVSDVDNLTNQFFDTDDGRMLFERILAWLNNLRKN